MARHADLTGVFGSPDTVSSYRAQIDEEIAAVDALARSPDARRARTSGTLRLAVTALEQTLEELSDDPNDRAPHTGRRPGHRTDPVGDG